MIFEDFEKTDIKTTITFYRKRPVLGRSLMVKI